MLAEKHGMSKKNADSFVKEFFLLIEESLEKDKYVKIKGLGTFKLIDVESRESVNVNTGERFEIQGHTKVSFTPEPTLKDIINKPFSHFETVVLNDSTVLEDTPLENEEEDEMSEVKEPVTDDRKEYPAVISEKDNFEDEILPQFVEEAEVDVTKKKTDSPTDSSAMKYFVGIVVFVVILCGGTVIFMYYPDLLNTISSSKTSSKETVESETDKRDNMLLLTDSSDVVNVIGKTDTVIENLDAYPKPKQDISEENVSQPILKKEQKKKTTVPFEPDSVGYTIVGTETTYTIKEGETLTKVALRFYGTKALWPYIVKHNPEVIKNPDNVPFGTTIKIPKLAKRQ